MVIIPAIDLKEGKCVRLKQGRMDTSTVFNEHPSQQASEWESLGAARIHVVDLDGSVGGKPANLERIREIVRTVNVPVQLGGGIRDETTIKMYLDIGVSTVILGTIAAKQPEKVLELLNRFPGKIAVGIDALDGWVAVEGWTESTRVKATDLAKQLEPGGPASFIYTDIDRDGMMRGPNFGATREFALGTSIPVILSGGVSAMKDVENALPLKRDGVWGIIIGRALYEGTVDLRQAIEAAGRADAC
ncbi:1-(5-phosphoribosyl)-5-[(5-phosphoribosylamino)methylideneamino]imidazole-4-carboxamide isomerase [Thermodesulfobacteriota bacterium]